MKKQIIHKGCITPYPEYKLAKNFINAVILINDEKRALEFEKNLKAFLNYFKKHYLIADIPASTEIHNTLSQFKRNYAVYNIQKNKKGFFIVNPDALNISISAERKTVILKTNTEINLENLLKTLIEFGYVREDFAENEGEFSFKGSRLTINIPFEGLFYIDFFGDEIENIYKVSKLLTKKPVESVEIFQLYDFLVEYRENLDIYFKKQKNTKLKDLLKNYQLFSIDLDIKNADVIFKTEGKNEEISKIPLKEFKTVRLSITKPLYLIKEKISFIPENISKPELELKPINIGDYVIHEDFGIGIFKGMETKNIRGKDYDFMVLEYADGEKINVSYLHFDKIFKYDTKENIKLDKLGGTSWRNLKKKVKKSLENIAKQIIKLYSEREKIIRKPYYVNDELIEKFEESFEYLETPDQLKAIEDVKKDLQTEKPMDRLICGDVGFGKTEVAVRASFISALNGKQTLVLVPTTVLSYQHYKKFKERLEPFGITVENLSRLKSKKQTEEILKELEEGKIDIIVGTHKALSKNVKFKNLGLLIIDEEHRFGVRAKEKIKQLKKDVDTLYLTATPIPRTLNMAISGFKKLSVINTPPEGRVETKTFVSKYSPEIVKKAIENEIKRGGQVFYLHNRIETIEEKTKQLKEMFPQLNISYIHGRMKPSHVEKEVLKFINKQTDVLVATSIIETGIDIPTANTLIVERADLFGLAQLYHLRGRVGRGNIQAFCYLLLPEDKHITETAEKRISTIMRLTRPGSGLKVALEDMKIRGAGNILGVEQSGYIKAVGFDFYVKLLKNALQENSNQKKAETIIETDLDAYIPSNFINDKQDRMNIYLSISKAVDENEVEEIENHLNEFYSDLPNSFKIYLQLEKIKKLATQLGIKKIKIANKKCKIYFGNLKEEKIIKLIEKLKPEYIHSDSFELKTDENFLDTLYFSLKELT